jgi:UDP-3-O-[3-hydroxymyristoyl] glucosamine N-acyltransferase
MLVRDVAAALSAQLMGDGSLAVERLVHPAAAVKPSDLAVAMTSETLSALSQSSAQAAVISDKAAPPHDRFKAVILAAPERGSLARLTALFDRGPSHAPGVHPGAIVAPDAVIGAGVSIGPLVTIGPRSRIGAHSVVMPNVTIGADVAIGERSLIYSGVRIGDRVTIGERAIIQFNAAIGADGFSFLPPTDAAHPMPMRVHSLGDVIIGNDVEIGASTTIDRATLATTRIGDGTKIDNQVQIAHNVTIGNGCLICGMVGISGSVEIGDRVVLGGGVGIGDHVKIGAGAMIAAGSGIATNVPAGAKMSGYPAMPHDRNAEAFAFLMRHKRVTRDLESTKARLDALENATKKK